jgi:LCP family protein required for cell wall assembly
MAIRLARAIAALLAVILVAAAARLGFAIHEIAPSAGFGDFARLISPPPPSGGSLADAIRKNQRVNILLLAHGGAGGDNPNFTDTMIVVSIRPVTHAATVIALPRYLWVRIPAGVRGDVEGKLYSAYALGAGGDPGFLKPRWLGATGAGNLTAATVSTTIGQSVPYWFGVDTDAFVALIDDLGGVRITVPTALDDPSYPVGDSGQTIHVHFDSGPQVLDGTRALEYARSRLSTSDADRSRRQELVLVGLLQSLRSPHPGLGALWSLGPLQDGLRTNLRPVEMRELAQLVMSVREADVKRVTLDDSGLLEPRMLGTAQILVPRGGTFQAVQAYIADRLP